MTPERKQELRECNQDRYWDGARYSRSALAECLDEIDRLEARQQEHLALIQRLSQEVPLQSEVSEALAQRGRLLAEIGTLRSQLAEARGPQTIDLDAIGETPDDIEVIPWPRSMGPQAWTAWHRPTGLAVVVSSERSMRENTGKAVLQLREALAECSAIWRER